MSLNIDPDYHGPYNRMRNHSTKVHLGKPLRFWASVQGIGKKLLTEDEALLPQWNHLESLTQ